MQSEILTPSCAAFTSCHKGGQPAGGLNLEPSARARLVNQLAHEKPGKMLVAPGDPDASFLLDKLLNRDLPTSTVTGVTYTSMPPGTSLEAGRLDLVRDWIQAGAKDD